METRKELTKEVSRRYQRSSRREKREILNEFCRSIGYNRHYAAYLLRNHGRQVGKESKEGCRDPVCSSRADPMKKQETAGQN